MKDPFKLISLFLLVISIFYLIITFDKYSFCEQNELKSTDQENNDLTTKALCNIFYRDFTKNKLTNLSISQIYKLIKKFRKPSNDNPFKYLNNQGSNKVFIELNTIKACYLIIQIFFVYFLIYSIFDMFIHTLLKIFIFLMYYSYMILIIELGVNILFNISLFEFIGMKSVKIGKYINIL